MVTFGFRALHTLSKRWVVFVPAGVVLHDPLALSDPVLFPTRIVASLGPVAVGDTSEFVDLTGGAPGLVLELRMRRAIDVPLAEPRVADRVRFSPVSPGAVIAEAAGHSR
jgi:hypothetical protein